MASFKGFSFRSMTPSSNGNEAGRLVTGCRQAFTSWDPNHVTIMLPMAAKDPDTGDFAPFKQGAGDESDFGPVIIPFQAVQFALDNNINMVLERYPGDPDVNESPYATVYNALRTYVENDENAPMAFHRMIIKDETSTRKGSNLIFPPMETFVAMPVITLLRKNEEVPIDNLREVEIYLMKRSVFFPVRDRIYELWNQGVDMNATSPSMGRFLVVWNKERTASIPGVNSQDVFGQGGTFGYNFAMTQRFPNLRTKYDGAEARLTPVQIDAWRKMIRPIDKYVNYIDWEEQARLICKYAPSGPIIYAWKDTHPEWISPDVWRRAKTERQIVDIGACYPTATVRQQPEAAPAPARNESEPPFETGDSAFPVLPAQSSFGGGFLGGSPNSVTGAGREVDDIC